MVSYLFMLILLMEEIPTNNHLGCIKYKKPLSKWDKLDSRISSVNIMVKLSRDSPNRPGRVRRPRSRPRSSGRIPRNVSCTQPKKRGAPVRK